MPRSTPEAASLAPDVLAKYEPVIGLEVHVQLLTRTKIFCGCSTRFGDPPNTNVCPVCLGLPGTLPVLNKRAVEMAMRASLALNCTVHDHSRFARKNYFYPDLPKGYQISQYELPLATNGHLEIEVAGARKRIGITRLHLEEDAAKNLHEGFSQSATKAYIDYNRCGTPLSEIVSEPDMRTPEEAYAYLITLRQILLYTGVSDCNMEEGSLRCDANVSVRPRGAKEFGTKVEVKNLNSFRYLQKALEFEIERHIAVLESGGRISQETRLWNQAEGHTVSMRSKEKAHDYRYFPEPDLLPVHISPAWREEVRRTLPELPEAKRARFVTAYGITPYDAEVLTSTQAMADYFESAAKAGAPGKAAANWIQTELLRGLKDTGKEIWRALTAPEIGYAPPVIQTIAGKRQLVIWHPDALAGLEPETGKVLWTHKYPITGKPQRPEVTIATPRVAGDRIFVTSFYHGSALLEITNNPFGARVVWDRHSTNQSSFTEGLHTTMTTPFWKGDYIYGLCGEGELRCLDAKTGDRVWESDAVCGTAGPFATVFFVQQADRVFVWNDQGELILGRITPKGFEQISKAKLLETSENTRGRDIVWCHPAFANRRAYVHNGKELICVELGAGAG